MSVLASGNKKRWLLALGAALWIVVAVVLSILARGAPPLPGDLGISLYLQEVQSWGLLPFMQGISFWGEIWVISILVAIASLGLGLRGKGRDALFLFSTLAVGVVGLGLKLLISRPRPGEGLLQIWDPSNSGSFPSGHALQGVVVLGATIFLFHRYINRRWLRLSLEAVLVILVLLIGVSRIYLGAHWASDVLGGYLIGGIFLFAWIICYALLSGGEK